jgi:predicted nucleotidyltransferase component of viral defense system
MISQVFIENWQQFVPWQTMDMVEQDLIICRALISLYSNPIIRESLVFRGGTALNKLFIKPAARYSEDIDFVQRKPEPIGKTLTAIRGVLDAWLGEPKRKLTARSAKLIYEYVSISNQKVKLKIEINTTEHFQVLDLQEVPFVIENHWFAGHSIITTYQLEELMATKLRALYQRRKGRDLFDVWLVFNSGLADIEKTIEIFKKYCAKDSITVPRDIFEKNMLLKRVHNDFKIDMKNLLAGHIGWEFNVAFEYVMDSVISKI